MSRVLTPFTERCCEEVIMQVRLRMSQHVSLVRGQGTRPAKVPAAE